jgi:RHS repeat-associated protein
VTAGGTVTFKYDPFGRRIEKSSTATTSVFVYDKDNLIEQTSGTGAVAARYSQGLGLDEQLAELSSGTTSFYEADGLSSVTSLSISTGATAESYAYDSFGNIIATTGALTNPFQYAGREFDSETSLYYYRARYYDPAAGRFLSEDPLEFAADGPNFYVYTNNSPVNWVDPMGTSILCPTFIPWCSPDIPPPPTPRPPGQPHLPGFGGYIYNHPPPRTQPVSGEALGLANCMASSLGTYFIITGGSECTPDGRHKPGSVVGSKHCTNQAIDISPAGMDQNKVLCAAGKCGAQYIQDEGDHLHIQTTPGKHGGHGLLPQNCPLCQ